MSVGENEIRRNKMIKNLEVNNLDQLKIIMANLCGYSLENMKKGLCVHCDKPFTNNNVFTEAGWKETKISGLCERCFDEIFTE